MDPLARFPFFRVNMKPDDEGAGGLDDNDGTLVDATRAMPDIEALERGESGRPAEREANGRFKGKEGAEAEKVEAKADPASEPEKAAEPAEGEDEEDYLEFAPEKEGEEPKRHKVSEVWAGYQKAQTLEAEIAALKSKSPMEMSADVEKATSDLVRQMAEYEKANEIWASMQQVREPSMELLNEASEHYNPTLYAQLKQQSQKQAQDIAKATAEMQRVGKERAAHEQRLEQARFQREQAKLNEFWPELMADKAVQQQVMVDAEKAYGFKAEDFNGLSDHRHYKVLKDALAYRAAKEKTEAAVKVVRAKPKLVKGAARSSVNPKDAKRADAMDRLSKSGSIDDAADALEGFLH